MTSGEKKLSGAALGKFQTPGLQDELITLVRRGNTRAEAAKRCKIAPRTFGYWMARGVANLAACAEVEEREPGAGDSLLDEYGMFRLEIEAAEAAVEASLKDVIFKKATAGDKDSWKAGAWILERRFWKNWGKRSLGGGAPESEDGLEKFHEAGLSEGVRQRFEMEVLGVELSEGT